MKLRNLGLGTGLKLGAIAIVVGLLVTRVALPSLDWNDGAGGMSVIISVFMYGVLLIGGYAIIAIGAALVLVSVLGWAFAKYYGTLETQGKKWARWSVLSVLGLAVAIGAFSYKNYQHEKAADRYEAIAAIPFSLFVDTSITSDHLHGVEFVDDNTGWAYTYGTGKIFRTDHSGHAWRQIAQLGEIYFEQMKFLDKRTGVLVGEGGQVLLTSDGGHNWRDISPASWNVENEIYVYGLYLDDTRLIVSTMQTSKATNDKSAKHFVSLDLGGTWHETGAGLPDMAMTIEKTGSDLIAGGSGLYLSRDKGATWQELDLGNKGQRLQLRAFDREGDHAFVADFATGKTFHSDNGWQIVNNREVTSNRIRDLKIVGKTVIAVGDANEDVRQGSFHISYDNGKTWRHDLRFDDDLHRMAETMNYIYVVGKNGRVIGIEKRQFLLRQEMLGRNRRS